MHNDDNNQTKKAIIAIIVITIVSIFALIAIAVLVNTFSEHGEARIANESGYDPNETTESDLSRVKKELYKLLETSAGANHDFDVTVRWDTLTKITGAYPKTSYLVDIDEYQQTYRVTVDSHFVKIDCPKPGETKYPDSFCIGNNGENNDTIFAIFGDNLPYDTRTSAGEYVSISRGNSSTTENGNNRYLQVYVRACPWTEDALGRARETTEELITSLGGSPAALDIRVMPAGGCHNT